MNPELDAPSARLAPGVLASTVIGIAAAACAWLLTGIAPAFTGSYTRLDQLAALGIGGVAGAAILGARAFRQRGEVVAGVLAGAILGGVGALSGASLIAFVHAAATPRIFFVERVGAWALSCAGAALFLGMFVDRRAPRRIRESALIACGGGAIAGVIFTLPGAADVWQAVACLWFGGTLGFAVAGPESWHAMATIALLPARGEEPGLLALREWMLHEGSVLALGEAQLACVGGRIALYPPAGGVIAAGHTVRRPKFMTSSGTIAVGRARYHLRIQRIS